MQLSPKLLGTLTDLLAPELRGSSSLSQHLAVRLRALAVELELQGQVSQPASKGALPLVEVQGDSLIAQPAEPAVRVANVPAVQPELSEVFTEVSRRSKHSMPRQFDFDRYLCRSVALELFYFGEVYQGYARQDHTANTIEGHLFSAMRQTKLIPHNADWQSLKYSRCGRTDKGVSALSQVLALQLRSSAKKGEQPPEIHQELDYLTILNRVLPLNIKVLGWTPVPEDFSARFDAVQRGYKYFIPQHGELNINNMQQAASYFVGEHDFRNFCKADVRHVSNFRRTILDFQMQPEPGIAVGGIQLWSLYVKGSAFLWHQVRCMAAILLMVGRGQESPTIVQQLLDIGQHPCKPQYNMLPEVPLLFHSCSFEGLQFHQPAHVNKAIEEAAVEALDHHAVRQTGAQAHQVVAEGSGTLVGRPIGQSPDTKEC
ncbi:hypothetical protein WJX74_005182 [Apatococcus lobatus]|uniref:tRNA pseudouridine synthase n=1 Tax=Apatococcus lobatus TaxID=904363 RepID=A0AAW1QLU0_9CHLO